MKNTISSINISKVSPLLSLLEEFIYEDSKNLDKYSLWIREIIIKHIGVILSNGNNKAIISRLRKFAQRKVSER